MTVENISLSISTKECCRPRRGLNPLPPGQVSTHICNFYFHCDHICTPIFIYYYGRISTYFYALPQNVARVLCYTLRNFDCPSIRQRFHHLCPLNNTDTIRDIFTKLHTNVKHYETWLAYFWNFPINLEGFFLPERKCLIFCADCLLNLHEFPACSLGKK